jgi:hypothetical protein
MKTLIVLSVLLFAGGEYLIDKAKKAKSQTKFANSLRRTKLRFSSPLGFGSRQ